MRRKLTATVFALFLLACSCLAQSVKLPPEVKVDKGRLAAVKIEWDGDDVKWIAPPELDVFREYDPDPKVVRLRLIGNKNGKFPLHALAAKGGKLSDPATCYIIVGDVPPDPGPGPKPPDPPVPPDPTPSEGKWLIMVWESSNPLSKGQASVTTSAKVRTWIRANLKKDGGLPDGEFVFWDKDTSPEGYSQEWKERWVRAQEAIKRTGKPTMIYSNGKSLIVVDIPDDVDKCLEILNKTTSVKPVAPEGKGSN